MPTNQAKTDISTACGCGGDIKPEIGCAKYIESDDFDTNCQIQGMLWSGGLGFGSAVYDRSWQGVMSMHLQENGIDPEHCEEILLDAHLR